jgi:acyl-homoserine lactone acylase PvdQ
MTNRSLRALELLGGDDEITFDEFLAYKYDMAYNEASAPAQYRERLLNAEFPAGEDVTEALDLLRNWDLSTHPESTSASLMLLTLYDLDATVSGFSGSRLMKFDATDDALVTSFLRAIEQLQTHHGRLDVPWGEINRLRRGTVDIPIGGAPDVLHAVYGDLDEGTITGTAGDSYVLMVRWDAQGQVESQSIHQFGAATLDETSPHYADQAALFAARKLKPVWLDEVDILANLEREYRPGE